MQTVANNIYIYISWNPVRKLFSQNLSHAITLQQKCYVEDEQNETNWDLTVIIGKEIQQSSTWCYISEQLKKFLYIIHIEMLYVQYV